MLNPTQFADANKASYETLIGLSQQAFQGVEKHAALNLQVVKTLLAEFAEGYQAALAVKTPDEFFKLQVAALQAAPQKALAYGRQVADIYAEASSTLRSAAEAQVAEVQAKFLEAVNASLKNAPGSEHTVALVKQAVAAANNAIEGVNKASKQVTEAVAANVAKISEAAVEKAAA